MTPDIGYALNRGSGVGDVPTSTTVDYEGSVSIGDLTVDITAGGNGWNGIGNPYTSAITLQDFLVQIL